MRTLVDIPERDVRSLDELAAKAKRSRAAEIREAIERHLRVKSERSWIAAGAGYWKDRKDIGDGLDYQYRIGEDRNYVPAEAIGETSERGG